MSADEKSVADAVPIFGSPSGCRIRVRDHLGAVSSTHERVFRCMTQVKTTEGGTP